MVDTDLLKSYVDARNRVDALKDELIEAQDIFKEAEFRIIAMARAEAAQARQMVGVDGSDDDWSQSFGPFTFYRSSYFDLSVTQGNMPEIRDWLLETEGDDLPFVEEVVSKKVLREHLLAKCESENLDPAKDLPAFLHANRRPTIGVKGWRKVKSEKANQ